MTLKLPPPEEYITQSIVEDNESVKFAKFALDEQQIL